MRASWLAGSSVASMLLASAALAQNIADTPIAPQSKPNAANAVDRSSAAKPFGVEDIVVTAQRRSERLQNVPIAVTAASAARLASAGVTSTQDLANITPGLSAPAIAGFAQPHIRGVGSSSNGPGLEPPVATYIDGVYLAAAPASLLTLNNVERIEVLKGPQGTLFGRNATGGLIQVVTKDPKHEFGGQVSLTYENYNDVVGDAYLTTGLSNTLAADLALRAEHQGDGWGHNLATGNDIGKLNHDVAARTKFLWNPGPDTTVRLALDYEDRVSSQEVQHLSKNYPATFNNAAFGGPYPLGRFSDVNDNFDPMNRLKAGGASLQVNQALGGVQLLSITAYRRSSYFFPLDLDSTPANVLDLMARANSNQVSQELQLSSTTPGRFKWVAGLFYLHANDRYQPLDINFGPTFVSPVPNAPVTISDNDLQKTDSYAGYAQVTYEVLSETHLTGGIRYTYEARSLSGNEAFIVGGKPVAVSPIPSPASGIDDHIHFSKFSYRASLDHTLTKGVLIYVSYNTGFKSGGYNLALASNAPYRPENIGAVEGGIKSEIFNRRLRLNVSGFHYDYKNIQVGRYVQGSEAIYNGARARLYGFDLDGEVAVTSGFTLTGGLSYTHATFSSFPDADFIVPVGGCIPVPGGVCSGSAKGKNLPYAPRFSGTVSADYQLKTSVGLFRADATLFHTTRFYAAPDNVAFQQAYNLVNASLSWTSLSSRFSIKGFVKNAFNKKYATTVLESGYGVFYQQGAPQTYGATAGFKF